MAKEDTTKNSDTLEKAVGDLQKRLTLLETEVKRLGVIEADVKDIKQKLAQRLLEDERPAVKLGKRLVKEGQTSDDQADALGARRNPYRNQFWKVEIPLFHGEDVYSWVLRVEHYFKLEDVNEEEKLRVVGMCFHGDALTWYRWERDRNPFMSWRQMKRRVFEEFSDMMPGERLLSLRQEGSARDYCRDFIALAIHAPEFSETVLEMIFMSGLKAKTRAGIRMFEPQNLDKMMSLSRRMEDWIGQTDDLKPYGGQ